MGVLPIPTLYLATLVHMGLPVFNAVFSILELKKFLPSFYTTSARKHTLSHGDVIDIIMRGGG